MDTDAPPPRNDDNGLPEDLTGLEHADGTREEYEALWQMLRQSDEATDAAFSPDDAWGDLSERIDPSPPSPAPNRRASDRSARQRASDSAPRRLRRWRAVAGVAVLIALAVGVGLWAARPVAVETAQGEQRTVTLPDGSVAELNGATTITYPRGFTSLPWIGHEARQVTLQGEAFFAVEPAARSFQVDTDNARIDVHGTSFNVRMRNRAERPVTEVTLASGQVQVQVRGASESSSVRLDEAGVQSRVIGRHDPTPPEPVDADQASAWRQGGFAVRNAPLPDVLRDLEAQFGVPIRLGVPAVRTDSMTLHYRRVDRLEAVLRDIALVQDMQYRKLNNGYELIPLDDSSSESP